jgi:hypothetical protein
MKQPAQYFPESFSICNTGITSIFQNLPVSTMLIFRQCYYFNQRINVPNGYEEKSKDEFHHELFAGVIMQDT